MKKIFQIVGICALMAGLMVSCSTDPVEPETLPTPSGLKVETLTATSAELLWTAVTGAEKYNLSIDDGTPVVVISPSYLAEGLTAETAYTWKVQAVKGDIVSEWSAGSGFTTLKVSVTDDLPAPAGLTVGTVTTTTAELSWEAVAGAEKYNLSIDDETPIEVTAVSYLAEGLTAETAYTWKVQAVKGDIVSEWAAGSGFTTLKESVKEDLPAPAGLTVGTVTATTAALAWTAVTGAEKYNLSVNEGTPIEVVAASYLAEGLTAATDYTWKVQAVKGDIVSEWSADSGFRTLAEAVSGTPPTNLKVTGVTDKSAILSWEHADVGAIHEVVINDGAAIEVASIGYNAVGLTPETRYTWKVRSKIEGGQWSEWVDGPEFTTSADIGDSTRLVSGKVTEWYGDEYYGYGTENYIFQFTEYEQGGTALGVTLTLDMCISAADLGSNSGNAFLDLPNVTFTFTDNSFSPAMNTIISSYSQLGFGRAVPDSPGTVATSYETIKSGTMTVTGNHADGYVIKFDIVHSGGTLSAQYNGKFELANPYL